MTAGLALNPPASVGYRLSLFVHDKDGQIRRFVTESSHVRVGAGADCELQLVGDGLANQHAQIGVEGDAVWLTDQSTLGTWVGGQLIQNTQVQVSPDDEIVLGPFRLRVQATPLEEVCFADDKPPVRAPEVSVSLRRRIHRELLENLDLVRLERSRMNDHLLRAKVTLALSNLVERFAAEMPVGVDAQKLVRELTHEAIGLGPLEDLLNDTAVSEIMVIDPATIYVERSGKIAKTASRFTDEESVRAILERIIAPLGRRIDESSPMLDARLPDGSRVNAIIRPLAIRGSCITIRKFPGSPLRMADLVQFGSLDERMARFLERCVRVRRNFLIAGGTGSGKTTLLNVLSGAIASHERIVTIEDAAELRLNQPHIVSLESRPPNMEGRGEVTIRDLVRNAMRMRPDRIIVGECRGGEALDMLQAMNTGHAGSMTTTHANSPIEALKRIETLALIAGLDLPARALREQIAMSLHLVVQQACLGDGSRKIVSIAEVAGIDDAGQLTTREIFGFRRLGTKSTGDVEGEFYATGYLPSFLGEFLTHGLIEAGQEVL